MNKLLLVVHTIALGLILSTLAGNRYVTDYGNGVIVRADRYVNSGEWVYNCQRSQLISRKAKPFPADRFVQEGTLPLSYRLVSPIEKSSSRDIVKIITADKSWHNRLEYTSTGIGEDSRILAHYYITTFQHENEKWTLKVGVPEDTKRKVVDFISITPNDPKQHKPHHQLFKEALSSCPAEQ